MHLDLDTRLSLAFVAGMIGLIEQTIIGLFGFEPSQLLIGAFITLMVGPIIGGVVRGNASSSNKNSSGDQSDV